MAGFRIEGNVSGNVAEVAGTNQLKIIPETNAITSSANIGGVRMFAEVDQGYLTNFPTLKSPEADFDYRVRVSQDLLLDDEWFSYTAQNSAKHSYLITTMTNAWTAGQMTTNSGNITTTTTGSILSTWAAFPILGTTTISLDAEIGFTAQPQANTFIEWGVGLPGTTTGAPTDGVFFRLSSAGLQGIASINGTEVSTGVFTGPAATGTWTYTNNKRYQFIVYQASTEAYFWVDDGTGAVLLGEIELPTSTGTVSMMGSGQVFFKQRITGGAGAAAISANISRYSVRQGGVQIGTTPSTQGNRLYGSYQALAGAATQQGLCQYVNSTAPTSGAPSNTAITAGLPGATAGQGLGGQGLLPAQVAAVTDGIWASYQVPTGSVNSPARRLVVRGVRLDAINQGAAVATTATTVQFSLAFGHTAVSLATTDVTTGATAAKAPRRLALGFMTWPIGAAIGAQPQGGPIFLDLGDAPVFVNPGEFFQLVGKFVNGTATASQTIQFIYQPVYGWE